MSYLLLNITMEEYIMLEEEKAKKHRKVFNWKTAKYGMIWYDEDVYDLKSDETKFPALVFNDNLTSNETFSCLRIIRMVITQECYRGQEQDWEPTIDDNDHFELKTQFLKELCDNTLSGLDHEDANDHVEKVLEIVDLFHVPNITQDQQELKETLYQAWERFIELLMKFPQYYLTKMYEVILFYDGLEVSPSKILDLKGPYYTNDYPLKEEGKTLEEAYYTQFGAPFQQGGQYIAGAPRFYQRNNANPLYQERRQSMEESLSKFMSESVKIHEENSNSIKEIRASTDATIRNQGALIKTLKIQIGQMSKRSYGLQFLKAYLYGASYIDNSVPQKEKDPGSFTLPCYINNVCFENALADLGASESLVLNRSLDPLYGDYIELNNLNVPLEPMRDQVDDLMPTVEEGEDKVGYKGKKIVGAFMNVHIFIGHFFVVTHFVVVENMDGYRDQDMGDVIIGEPFCKASCVEARRFEELIIIHNGNDNLTYQMA
nr:hypothetical protein [Tanacetum cinerariifolium]